MSTKIIKKGGTNYHLCHIEGFRYSSIKHDSTAGVNIELLSITDHSLLASIST